MPTSPDVSTEILQWSQDRPGWQRDALRRLLSTGEISTTEIDQLLLLCKAARGLAQPTSPNVLTRSHLPTKSTGGDSTSLVTLTHHCGANALASEQTIAFGPRLTIVYGQNAAGKSGYTRILKQACRSRATEKILGDLLSGASPVKLQATISFRHGAEETPTLWAMGDPPSDALAAVSVFDSGCAPVYLRDKTDVAFRPFGLDIFDRLASLCSELRNRLESEKVKLNMLASPLPTFAEATKVRFFIDHLSSLTKPEDLRSLAILSSTERARLEALRGHQRDLLSADPKARARELTSRADRVDLLKRHIADLFAVLRGSALSDLQKSAEALRAAQASLALLRTTALTPDLLPGTGEENWRKMWEAAEGFSGIAYPDSPFPALTDDARCPLCQQEIGVEAEARLRHFAEYVASTAQTRVREAERAYGASLSLLNQAVIVRPDIELAISELRLENEQLAQSVQGFLQNAGQTRKGINEALAQGVGFLASVVQSPEAELQAAALSLRERAKQLLAEQPTMNPEAISELKELEARLTLGEHMDAVLEAIERKKQLAAYELCLSDTTTQAITRKSTELTTQLVTDQLKAGFQEELKALEFNHLAVAVQPAGGARGTLFHRLIFTNAPGVTITNVLSEGESRTLSLASFLTELKTAESRSAIIFDDPVSSLDHMWRERIARRLVAEAATRQVIVFTHDILFLRFLADEATRFGVDCKHQYIQRDTQVGICTEDLPWIAMNTSARIRRMRERYQEAEKLFRTFPEKYEDAARGIYRLLREAWEQATTEVLLNDVVQRYRPSIETNKVRLLHDITPDDCKAIEAGMTECSRWLHDQPAADGTPFPRPDALKSRIDDLDGLVKAIKKRRP